MFIHTSFLMYSFVLTFILNNDVALGLKNVDFYQVEQCSLCSICKPAHTEQNETREFCTDPKSINESLKKSCGTLSTTKCCFRYGDWSELIGGDPDMVNTSDISILPPILGDVCYFNISFFDISRDVEIHQDTVFITHSNYSELPSLDGKWTAKRNRRSKYGLIYSIISKKGMFLNLIS